MAVSSSERSAHRDTTLIDVLSLAALALAVRLFTFVGLGFNDDSYYLEFAAMLYKGLPYGHWEFPWSIRLGVFGPVLIFWKLFGINELSTSAYFLLCAVGEVVLTYVIGVKLFGRRAAIIAAVLLTFFPIDVVFSTQVGPDIPFNFFYLAAVLLFLSLPESKGAAFFSGLCAGICYVIRENFILIFPLLLVAAFLSRSENEKRPVSFFIAGFAAVFLAMQLYFHALSGEWFKVEKVRIFYAANDMNSDPDPTKYFSAMFNLFPGLFEWQDNIPVGGFLYIAFFIATFFVMLKRDIRRKSAFVLLWAYGFLSFFQYFLDLINIFGRYILHPKQLRYLITISPPVCLLLGSVLDGLLLSSPRRTLRYMAVILVIFLSATSFHYAYSGARFIRLGMDDIRKAAAFLSPYTGRKTIYLPEGWDISKFMFFFKYDDARFERIKIYSREDRNYSDERSERGLDIEDALVVTDLSVYTHINKDVLYPAFLKDPPSNWVLLETINIKNRGIFSRYDPKIYYAPRSR